MATPSFTPGAAAAADPGSLTATQVQLLAQLSEAVSRATGLPPLVARLSQGVSYLVDFDQLALSMQSPDGRTWALVRPRLSTAEEPNWMELRDPGSALDEAARTDRPVTLARTGTSLLPPGMEASTPVAELSVFPSAIAVPVRGPDGPLGALGLFSSKPRAYGNASLSLLQVLGALVEACARKLVLIEEVARAERDSRASQQQKLELAQSLVEGLRPPLVAAEKTGDFAELRQATAEFATLARDAWDLTRLEAGELSTRRQLVGLDAWMKDRMQRHDQALKKAGLTGTVRCEPAGLRATIDADLLGRSVDHLLRWAIRRTPSKGQVTLVGRVGPGGSVLLALADSGPVLAEQDRGHFFSGDGTLPSVGLARAFCKAAVEAHGGSISVESPPGAGVLLRMTLPTAA